MARPLRIELAGHWYHLSGRGTERRRIFTDDRDRKHWLELLAETVGRYRLIVYGYVLMDNHYHGMVETREANLCEAMHWLQCSYSIWFNARHRRVGPLFQGRYKALVVDPEEWGLALSRYVHLNPVRVHRLGLGKTERAKGRAGAAAEPVRALVEQRVRQLREYRWSSYRAYIGLEEAPSWLNVTTILKMGGWPGDFRSRQKAYRQYAEEAVREGIIEKPWEQLKGQLVLGDEQLLKKVRQGLRIDPREQPRHKEMSARPAMKEVIRAVEKLKGEKWGKFCDRHGDWGRDVALYLGRRACGLRLRALGEAAGGMDYAAVSAAIKGLERKLIKEPKLASLVSVREKTVHFGHASPPTRDSPR